MKKKVVLAFSGGLDTSFCAIYLSKERKLEVHSVLVNTGGFSNEELKSIERQAYSLGVSSHTNIDEVNNFYNQCVKYLIYGNVLRNATYPLSVSAERVVQATGVARYAKNINADYVAHGSTGAGSDQVRFDITFNILIPEMGILTPIRDLRLSRQEEIKYLQEHGIAYHEKKGQYSINKGLWGTSVGGQETLHAAGFLPEEAWPTKVTETEPRALELSFEKGELCGLDGETLHSVEAIKKLQAIAQPYGIGRDIHVGDTVIGIKGRVGFEAAAPIIIIKAHHALEKHTLTKWQLTWKDQISAFYGNWLHEGQFHDPVMRNIESFLADTQKTVTGSVFIKLYPHYFQVLGIRSPHDLMSSKFGTYGEMNNSWSGEDVKGFSKIFGNQSMIFHQVNNDILSNDFT